MKKKISFVGIAAVVLVAILLVSIASSSLSKRKHYKASSDLGDEFFSGTIQIDDEVYDFPCKVSELMDDGWTSEDHDKTVESQFAKYEDLTKNGRVICLMRSLVELQICPPRTKC